MAKKWSYPKAQRVGAARLLVTGKAAHVTGRWFRRPAALVLHVARLLAVVADDLLFRRVREFVLVYDGPVFGLT